MLHHHPTMAESDIRPPQLVGSLDISPGKRTTTKLLLFLFPVFFSVILVESSLFCESILSSNVHNAYGIESRSCKWPRCSPSLPRTHRIGEEGG